MKNTVLFDLGNTLVQHYERSEFPAILEQTIAEAQEFLREKGLPTISPEAMWQRVKDEDHESEDYRVRPIEERLDRVFQLDNSIQSSGLKMDICRCFMRPIFAMGRCYEDAVPTLRQLKSKGFKTAIISNTSWDSPASLWREEIKRFGLSDHVDAAVFCRDVGWRKPAKQIFEFTLEKLKASPQQCIFVGDHPKWGLAGPRAAGIEKVIDGSKIVEGDCVLAVASNGLHTNGYFLVRALMAQKPEIMEMQVGEESFLDVILKQHKCYYQSFRDLFDLPELHVMAHITGGGIQGNLNRVLPENFNAVIDWSEIQVLPVFN